MKTKLVLFITLVIFICLSLNGVKNIFGKEEDKNVKSKDFAVESTITIVPDGDANKNNQIDAGDIVRFTYTIVNTTDKSYSYATLRTSIDRKQLNFIHSVRGATGLSDGDGTITFNNIRINSQEQRIISFDARINYFREDKQISTEPELVASDNKSVVKSLKKEVIAKKLSNEEIKKRIEKRGTTIKNSSSQL